MTFVPFKDAPGETEVLILMPNGRTVMHVYKNEDGLYIYGGLLGKSDEWTLNDHFDEDYYKRLLSIEHPSPVGFKLPAVDLEALDALARNLTQEQMEDLYIRAQGAK